MKKLIMPLALTLSVTSAFAQSMSGNDFSGSNSGEGYSTTNISGSSYYKQDVKLLVPEAILVLQGAEASDEFRALRDVLSAVEGEPLSDKEAAKLIIQLASDL